MDIPLNICTAAFHMGSLSIDRRSASPCLSGYKYRLYASLTSIADYRMRALRPMEQVRGCIMCTP